MGFLLSLLGGPIVNAVMGVVKNVIDKKMTEAEARAEIEKAVLGTISEITKSQADVIMAETRSEDWLTRNWRPVVALTAFFSYWWVIIGIPHVVKWEIMAAPSFGELGLQNMFYLTTVCVGGYVGGRSLEKITDMITRRK